ncbi:hypothetical protein F0919_14825 [Taibaiella lutea]|uniref:Aromatic hydrocarbon degradation protein n=1 Tax=Taibaiella lutea TaxID=2608001 RepID=A0A5M6CHA2_9BACT|nr:hypothetical protein [Taibaiella lutea]KAA5533800.1 hypothetical protein F0919_14825 [Taibaiella lutea]
MRYLNIILASAVLFPATAMAQNEIDALRYSQVTGAATARSLGLGGAGGSYGGDFSSLSINPAGIGIYRSSEIMVTPILRFNNMTGNYLGTTSSDDNTKMTLGNFGAVFTTANRGKNYQKSAWKAFSFGVGYNRVADFNSHGYYEGTNSVSSMTEGFAADAKVNGVGVDFVPPFGYFGYEGYLIDTGYNSIPYENIIKKGGSLNQSKQWKSKGGINEWAFSVGGNYMEKLMLGATMGITSYKYDRTQTYYEGDATGNTNNDFQEMYYDEDLSTTGIGINFKLGAIYVVNDYFRIGGAFHSPTWSSFSDVSSYNMDSYTEGYKASLGAIDKDPHTNVQPIDQSNNTIIYQYDYSLRTPWRGVLSATAFMGKYGFITADYEYAAYNSMRYSFTNNYDYERIVNNAIKDTYKGTHNFRLGIEGKMDNFSARAGFAYYSSPYKNADYFAGDRMDLSAGVGGRFGKFFVDLTYVHSIQKNAEFLYPNITASNDQLGIRQTPVNLADLKYGNNLVALTMGVKF